MWEEEKEEGTGDGGHLVKCQEFFTHFFLLCKKEEEGKEVYPNEWDEGEKRENSLSISLLFSLIFLFLFFCLKKIFFCSLRRLRIANHHADDDVS